MLKRIWLPLIEGWADRHLVLASPLYFFSLVDFQISGQSVTVSDPHILLFI